MRYWNTFWNVGMIWFAAGGNLAAYMYSGRTINLLFFVLCTTVAFIAQTPVSSKGKDTTVV